MKKCFCQVFLAISLLCFFSCNHNPTKEEQKEEIVKTRTSSFSKQVFIKGEIASDNFKITNDFLISLENDEFDFDNLKVYDDITSWFSGVPSDIRFEINDLSNRQNIGVAVSPYVDDYPVDFLSYYTEGGISLIKCTIPGDKLKSTTSFEVQDTKGSYCQIEKGNSKTDLEDTITTDGLTTSLVKCYQIAKVSIPSSVQALNNSCFYYPKYVIKIEFEDDNISSSDNLMVLQKCTNLKSIKTNKTLEQVKDSWGTYRIGNYIQADDVLIECSDGSYRVTEIK